MDRRYYELCAMSELKNALRSGDVWVEGSRQHSRTLTNTFILRREVRCSQKLLDELPTCRLYSDCEEYLHERLVSP